MQELTLKKIRINKGISQSDLANQSGVSLRTIQEYEQGRKSLNKASGETLYKLAKALNCNIEDLLNIDPLR